MTGRTGVSADRTRNGDTRLCLLTRELNVRAVRRAQTGTERAFPTAYGSITSVKMGARSRSKRREI